jgi:hypothetical protein
MKACNVFQEQMLRQSSSQEGSDLGVNPMEPREFAVDIARLTSIFDGNMQAQALVPRCRRRHARTPPKQSVGAVLAADVRTGGRCRQNGVPAR